MDAYQIGANAVGPLYKEIGALEAKLAMRDATIEKLEAKLALLEKRTTPVQAVIQAAVPVQATLPERRSVKSVESRPSKAKSKASPHGLPSSSRPLVGEISEAELASIASADPAAALHRRRLVMQKRRAYTQRAREDSLAVLDLVSKALGAKTETSKCVTIDSFIYKLGGDTALHNELLGLHDRPVTVDDYWPACGSVAAPAVDVWRAQERPKVDELVSVLREAAELLRPSSCLNYKCFTGQKAMKGDAVLLRLAEHVANDELLAVELVSSKDLRAKCQNTVTGRRGRAGIRRRLENVAKSKQERLERDIAFIAEIEKAEEAEAAEAAEAKSPNSDRNLLYHQDGVPTPTDGVPTPTAGAVPTPRSSSGGKAPRKTPTMAPVPLSAEIESSSGESEPEPEAFPEPNQEAFPNPATPNPFGMDEPSPFELLG
jgi:hypothetical protein